MQKPENSKLSLFFFFSFLLFFSASQFLCCIFFFPLSASPTFSVLSVLTRINFNRMPQQISNRSTPRFLFGSSHTKKRKRKSMKARHSILSSSPGRRFFVVVSFFFFSFIFLPFFSVVEDLVARRVCSFLFFFLFFIFNPSLLPQYRPSPTVEMHKCQHDTRSCPLFFTPALSFFTLLMRGTACNSTRFQRAK